MKKQVISIIAAAALTFSVASTALAATQGVVEKSVNFRSAPSTSSTVYGLVKAGTVFTVLEEVNSYWVRASVNGQTGYLSTNYITYSPGGGTTAPLPAAQGVVEKGVNFRSAPSTSSSVYGLLKAGTVFTVLEEVNSYWVRVSVNGQTGYLSTDYIRYSSGGSQPTQPAPQPEAPASVKADNVIIHSRNLIGITRYKYGVNNPQTLMDCSAFTKYVFSLEGVSLKWGTRYQKDAGTAVSKANLQKGDLVFFWTSTRGDISHVGIYIGNGQFIHNSPSLDGVGVSSLTSGYWEEHYVSARRVL
ncbi:MAG: hypothetical protein K0R57_6125 [Paenibacillaceae bacterium]|nr:hypothetical protein [Paenibacillaceae bacterium]